MTPEPLTPGFAAKPVLTGEKTVLRPFTAADADTMAEIIEDPEVLRFTGESPNDLTPGFLRSWYGSRSAQTDRLDLAVTDRATGQLVGEVVLYEWDPADRACTFRTLLGPAGRNRGIGTEAVRLVVGHGFDHIGLHRIALDVFGHNHRAHHVYEKVGFTEEGRTGGPYDEIRMSVLAPDWAKHRGRP
ncbi:GNAT family protein [Streptomyces sp. NPDC046821]|uniref:GNAT family N-acetyltransferase n=1 Tax=Streptomyces sp. NPDC046821 TaxID=3154702 RepID=UPI003403F672